MAATCWNGLTANAKPDVVRLSLKHRRLCEQAEIFQMSLLRDVDVCWRCGRRRTKEVGACSKIVVVAQQIADSSQLAAASPKTIELPIGRQYMN